VRRCRFARLELCRRRRLLKIGDRRDQNSIVHLTDGSAFHPLQVVAPNTLPNYTDEVLKLTAGCAVEVTGTVVPSPAKGQPFEMQAPSM
jgi:aspartyl/asparaginyl-tRNA synthetase